MRLSLRYTTVSQLKILKMQKVECCCATLSTPSHQHGFGTWCTYYKLKTNRTEGSYINIRHVELRYFVPARLKCQIYMPNLSLISPRGSESYLSKWLGTNNEYYQI